MYRNQYYVARAYGNLLGLSRLQAFIAGELGLGVGELVCHATHAHLDGSVGSINALLVDMRQALVNLRPGQAAASALHTSAGG